MRILLKLTNGEVDELEVDTAKYDVDVFVYSDDEGRPFFHQVTLTPLAPAVFDRKLEELTKTRMA